MRLSFYFRELRASGGKTVGVSILKALAERSWPHEITAYVPDDPDYKIFSGSAIRIVAGRNIGGSYHIFAHRSLRNILKKDKQDAIFMLGNLGLFHSPCPQAVFIHNAYFLYSDSLAWKRLSLNQLLYVSTWGWLVKRWLKQADIVVSQTPVMLHRLNKLCHIPYEKMFLLPPSCTPLNFPEYAESSQLSIIHRTTCKFKILYIARYMPHKNLDILLQVADKLIEIGRDDFEIFVTISPEHGMAARRFLSQMRKGRKEKIIYNLGEISMANVNFCYKAADVLLMPTLLESFCIPYLDAMYAGIPIITSDLDFAHIVCGEAALYVDPLDPVGIISALIRMKEDGDMRRRLSVIGKERAKSLFLSWNDIADKMIMILEHIAQAKKLPNVLEEPWMKQLQTSKII